MEIIKLYGETDMGGRQVGTFNKDHIVDMKILDHELNPFADLALNFKKVEIVFNDGSKTQGFIKNEDYLSCKEQVG